MRKAVSQAVSAEVYGRTRFNILNATNPEITSDVDPTQARVDLNAPSFLWRLTA